MTIEEKVGQMFHPPISINGGTISEIMNLASGRGDTTESLILNKNITHYNLYGSPNPLQLAKIKSTSENCRKIQVRYSFNNKF